MNRLALVASAALAALSLCACDTLTGHTRSLVHAQTWLAGAGGENRPDGTVVAVVGGAGADVTAIPYVDTKSGKLYALLDCRGGQTVPSVETGISTNANVGSAGKLPIPAFTANNMDAMSETAVIDALARLQAANPGVPVAQVYWGTCAPKGGAEVTAPPNGANTAPTAPTAPSK